jgi:hypothetical protein
MSKGEIFEFHCTLKFLAIDLLKSLETRPGSKHSVMSEDSTLNYGERAVAAGSF